MAFPAELLAQDEELQFELRPHWRALVLPVVALMVLAAGAAYLAARVGSWFPDPPVLTLGLRLAVVGVAVVLAIPLALLPLARWMSTLYVFTDRRIIIRSGLVTRYGRDMPLSKVNNVSFQQRLLERVLGCGTLIVESASEHGMLVIADVPAVQRVQREVYRLHEDDAFRVVWMYEVDDRG